MILCLEYMHSKNIIYRDLKPENIMVDRDGIMYLIDLGTAEILQGRAFTMIGTPHYMAPEVYTGKGYSFLEDLWSLDVCMFEFINGGLPFGEDYDDPFEIYSCIMKGQLIFGYNVNKSSKDFIK